MLRTVLFDMGNVLVFFCHDRMCSQLGALCGRTGGEMRRLLLDSHLQWEFERGQLSEAEFCNALSERVGQPLNIEDVRRAGSDIFEPHDEMLPILAGLRDAGIRLVLMSNTSISHLEWVRAQYTFLDYFDDLVLSYEAGAIKPEPAIYEVALSKIECPPEQCFYTDDIAKYVEAGREHGLQAEVFRDAATLRQHLGDLGVALA